MICVQRLGIRFVRRSERTTPDLSGTPPPGTLIAFAMVARARLFAIHIRGHDATTTDSRYFYLPRLDRPVLVQQSAGTVAEAHIRFEWR